MTQHGFFFDQSRCTGCHTCSVACKSVHELPPGPLKYLRIYQYEKGAFPNVRIHVQWLPCYHCEKPFCVDACPTGAMVKEERYGAVLINQDECNGCRLCYRACPYGAPVFESDDRGGAARKCDMCIDRLEQEASPVCVRACPMRALDFGPMKELRRNHGQRRDLSELPDSQHTEPAVVFKPAREKRQVVPYDAGRALELLKERDSLPQIFAASSEVMDIPRGVVGRDGLAIKHDSVDDLMRATRNDDG